MRGPSPHLSWHDFGCHSPHGSAYPQAWRESRAVLLAEEYEAIRMLCGGETIPVVSAYRTVGWQRMIQREARLRQAPAPCPGPFHVRGMALDLYPPTGMGVLEFYDLICRRARQRDSSLRGLGRYPTFVHVDIRPQPYLWRWTGRCTIPDQPSDFYPYQARTDAQA